MISLAKNEKLSLEKVAPSLAVIKMGTGWSSKKKTGFFGRMLGGGGEGIDLDASVIGYDEAGNQVTAVWYGKLRDTGITHSGDDRVGRGSGDNEVITIDLSAINPMIRRLIFTVNSFSGESFKDVDKAYVRLLNGKTDEELARYEISQLGDYTGLIMAMLTKVGSDWELTTLGTSTNGRTFHDMRELREYAR